MEKELAQIKIGLYKLPKDVLIKMLVSELLESNKLKDQNNILRFYLDKAVEFYVNNEMHAVEECYVCHAHHVNLGPDHGYLLFNTDKQIAYCRECYLNLQAKFQDSTLNFYDKAGKSVCSKHCKHELMCVGYEFNCSYHRKLNNKDICRGCSRCENRTRIII